MAPGAQDPCCLHHWSRGPLHHADHDQVPAHYRELSTPSTILRQLTFARLCFIMLLAC